MTARHALWAVIGVSTLLRFALAASMGGLIDEAYYVLYGQNLDWAYFDHPPMVGVVAALGAAAGGVGQPADGPAVRLHRDVRRVDVAAGPAHRAVLRRAGRGAGGARPELDALLRAGRRDDGRRRTGPCCSSGS